MIGSRYGKEVKVRRIYRRVGRRFTYVQRKTYDFSTMELGIVDGMEIKEDQDRSNEVYLEEDRLAKGLSERSRYFTRIRLTNGRRASIIVYRTRGPGRFRHELGKRQRRMVRGNIVRRGGSWKWYESDVDVTRIDRGRNLGLFLVLLGRRYIAFQSDQMNWRKIQTSYTNGMNTTPRNVRKRGVWRSRVVSIGRIENRRERSNRRSRRRLRRGYRRCIERSRRRIYRRKGRKKE